MPPRHPEAPVPPPEEIVVATKRVACDGADPVLGATLGHPLVYLDMGEDDFVECGYCDRRFVLAADARRESEYLDPGARSAVGH